MKYTWVFLLFSLLSGTLSSALAHPGSGLAVDNEGNVYFVHTGVGPFKILPDGKLERLKGPGYHFMTLDPKGSFAGQHWPLFPDGVIEVAGTSPKLLLASSFPITIGPDGALYYPEAMPDAQVHMRRLEPRGKPTTFAILPLALENGPDGKPVRAHWIHGLAAGSDGTLYYTEKYSVRKIDPDGTVSLVAADIKVRDCLRPPLAAEERHGPTLRGIAVAADGTLYVAASGCSAVLKITPKGELSVVLQSSDDWSPTGVVVSGEDLYVLEFLHIEVERSSDWLPRIRKISKDGTVTVIAAVKP